MDLTNLKRQPDEASASIAPRMIILWGHEDLLGSAVESILKASKDWQVIKILDNHDPEHLAREVEKVNPEILMVLQGSYQDLFSPPLSLIKDFPNLKIITINPENNFMEIFSKQKVWVRQASDFLTVIEQLENPEPKEVK